jgi:hypothetical protein
MAAFVSTFLENSSARKLIAALDYRYLYCRDR